ncbi:MAG: response regulator [Halobacteriovoraceae bacterium]|nr:response regulator [Halobacteriovoraceae bacterium]
MKTKSKKKCILVVEDESDLQELIGRKLERENFTSICCKSVNDALSKLANQVFDMIILDIKLEDGTGEDVIAYLKNKSSANLNKKTPVLVISGHMDAKLVDNIRDHIKDILVKPFTQKSLIDKVKEFL